MRFDRARTALRACTVALALCCGVLAADGASAGTSWLVTRVLTPEGYAGAVQVTTLAIDAQGGNVVAGVVGSNGFPGVDSALLANAGAGARFVARYDAATGARQAVAIVGTPSLGPGLVMTGLALDANGNAYLPAYSASLDFPVVAGTYVSAGPAALFRVTPLGVVARLATLDAAIRSVRAVALDPAGNVYLTGSAGPGLATTASAPYGGTAVAAGCIAPYATKLDRAGQVVYATYLGYAGTQGERCGNELPGTFDPAGYAIAADAAGNAYVTGQAEPGVRATAGAVDLAPRTATMIGASGTYVASHAFVTKINATGTALGYSARVGGNSRDRGTSIAIDAAGNAYVGGKTTTHSFPQPGTAWPQVGVVYECLLNTPELGFVAKLSADGARLAWSGLLPAAGDELDDCALSGPEAPLSIALDGAGNVLATGYTVPSNRSTTLSRNAMQTVDGEGLFAQIDGAGNLLYLSWLSGGMGTLAIDPEQNVRVAGYSFTQLSAGALPVEIATRTATGCADTPLTIDAQVAAAGNSGTVDFQVDGAHVGSALVRAGAASLSTAVANGVRRITAIYHGAGPFDGYGSLTLFVAVDQAGACG